MKQKIVSLLVLLLTAATGAWAISGLNGSGTQADPYLIGSAADWSEFCTNFDTYKAGHVALTADISVGNTKTPHDTNFSGTFSGNDHKLTVALESSSSRCAPFQYVDGGTIMNLHVDGTINTSGGYSGGIVGACLKLTLTGCSSSVTFTTTGSRDIGGLVGCMNTNGTLIITNCSFDGNFASTSEHCGGLVGGTYGSTVYATISNCLVNPGTVSVGNNSATIVAGGSYLANDVYYVKAIGTAQGTNASGMTADQLAATLGTGWRVVGGKVMPVDPLTVTPVAGQQNQWEFNMPASDVELTPIYSAATIYDADGETEKQAYETLKEAIAAVQDGDIIKLDWDVTLTEQLETPAIAGGAEFTLDLNGYIIDGNSGIYLNNVGDRLLFTDSSEGQTGGYIAGDLLGQTGSVFAFDAGRYKFGSNTAESLNDYCATPDSPWEMIDGKEFVDIDGAPDADGFTLRVDYKTFELAIPAGKFATFCDNHNVALAPGTDASVGLYTISSIDDERTTATATAISSAVVPGTMPMLVYNGSDADQKVKLKVSPDDATGAQTWAEAFQGTAIEHEFTATDMQDNDYYALSGGQYFVPVLSAGTIAAHKCWLQFPKQQTPASRSLTIVFEGNGTTGIADNKRESITNNRYYDLNGRQLNAAPTQKGVYILNGKKVVVK